MEVTKVPRLKVLGGLFEDFKFYLSCCKIYKFIN